MNQELDLKPHLFDGEEELLRSEMSGVASYLEFGMGGSTLLAARCGVQSIFAVDTDPAWIVKVETALHQSKLSIRVRLFHCDVGPTSKWGVPIGQGKMASWPEYPKLPWHACIGCGEVPGLIYVDGRFRVACTLYSILMLHLRQPKFPDQRSRIAIHDFVGRPHYNKVLDYADVVETRNTLVVLEKKTSASLEQLVEDLLTFQFDKR
jgi:hypothetical protein